MKRLCVILLAVALTVTMAPIGGAFAYAKTDDAVIEAAQDAGVDVTNKEEVDAFAGALDEAGIDLSSPDIAVTGDDEADVPEIAAEGGGAACVDCVPAVEVPVKAKKAAKAGKKIKSGSFDPVDDATAIEIVSGGRTDCAIENAGATVTYKFVPTKTGTYIFYSDTSSYDPKAQVLSSGGEELGDNDDIDYSGGNRNFRISFSATAGQTYYLQVVLYNESDTGTFDVYLMPDEYTAKINVSFNKKTGKATVSGTATGDTFCGLYVDGSKTGNSISGQKTFSGAVIDMKNYDVGFHTISAELTNHDAVVIYNYAVPTYIYGKPSVKRANFTTTSKCFTFENSGNYYSKDSSCKVYLDYKKKGGKWKNNYGPVDNYSSGTKKKLKPNTWYYVRGHYGKKVKYNGKTYFFSGKTVGYKSGSAKIKTGKKKKPAVKSIKITKAKQFSQSYTYTTTIYIGGYGYSTVHYVTQWYTSFKVTVKLKKKPGTAGIYIGNVRKKGNKKTYTHNFTVYGKQKGKKLKVEVRSYQNAVYKGYSPKCTKTVKVR